MHRRGTQAALGVTITAPGKAGVYEIWCASDRVRDVVFQKIAIRLN